MTDDRIVFERGVVTLPVAMWANNPAMRWWMLRVTELGSILSLPSDPNPFPRIHLFGRTPR
jgi:hypothetical protein